MSAIASRLAEGKINALDYNKEKDSILAFVKEKIKSKKSLSALAVWISKFHTYSYYFPLGYELYNATNMDLKEFVRILREMPFGKPEYPEYSKFVLLDRKAYFAATRKQEIKIEVYIDEAIKNLKKKNERPPYK